MKSQKEQRRATKSNEKQQKATKSNKKQQRTSELEKPKRARKNQDEQRRAQKVQMETRLYYTVKPRIREPPYFGIRLAKVLKLRQFNRTFLYAQTVGRERDNVIKLSSEITFGSSTGPYVFHKTIFIQNGL